MTRRLAKPRVQTKGSRTPPSHASAGFGLFYGVISATVILAALVHISGVLSLFLRLLRYGIH